MRLAHRIVALAFAATLAAAPARAALEPAYDESPFVRSEAPVVVVTFTTGSLGDDESSAHGGVVITREHLLFVDGPAVPLEHVEWVEPAQARPVRQPVTTDTLLKVGPGATLALGNAAGSVRVAAWPRNEVRVVAVHDRSVRVAVERTGGRLQLGARVADDGSPAVVEWSISVPAWLPVELAGREGDVEVTGLRAPVRARTMRGDVHVRSCQGPLQAHSVEGEVHVSDVDGNVTAGSVNNAIRIVRVSGPVEAQTVNGDIQLERLESPSVDASSVNGQVLVMSPFRPHGRYAFASHRGRVLVAVPDGQEMAVRMRSFNGQVEPLTPLPPPAPGESRRRAVRIVIRDDASPDTSSLAELPEVELESFQGNVQLASPDEVVDAILKRLQSRGVDLRGREVRVRRRYVTARGETLVTPAVPLRGE
ncbi:MAG: hypothetical protein RL721_2217 [Candidatus Eisenbacteria bacterium]